MEPHSLLVVDAANVVGARPDGWWRDRLGATGRLRDELSQVARTGLPGLPAPVRVVLVVEGAARGTTPVPGVEVVAAPGSGDDAIVELLRTQPTGHRTVVVVVTADRQLRQRVGRFGAEVRGPTWVRRGGPAPAPDAQRTATPETPSGDTGPNTG